ncbi:MAG TPA: ATP-binding protein, partial [Paludibacter sp.]|nr:ATP-binding protein [Paludibacter sp.]
NEVLVQQNQKITHQKEELITLSKKVQEANVDKIGFFTNITHEFRTPITLILGPVERALKLSTNPKVLEQLNIVQRNSRLLLSLINQLMDFRKVDSGKMELVKTQQNFIEFLDDIILPFEELVKDRGITFRKQYRINPPEFLFDRDNMQKVMGNLLSNAIKFTPDRGQISVIASTYTDKSDQKERLYVAVKDTGKGVLEEDMKKIFERFYQSKQNQAYSGYGQSGTGIGLYLCKRIIQLHNGKIEVRNQPTGGSSFRFIIPIERRISTVVSLDGKPMEMIVANQNPELDNISDEISKGKPVLLIVEDNSDMRQYIRSILSMEFNVLEAPNGVVGLEITNRYQPDLIISDIMMPEMDGLEFCKRVKTSFTTSHIPIMLLTAKSSTDTQIESFHHGADAFLVKPFDEELLKAVIRNLSEKRKRIQLNFAESMDTDSLNFDDESLDKKFIDKALKVIKENYTNPDFDVAEFIDAMGISRSLLHKKLTNLAGQSASRFIRVYRLNIARELIIKNRASHSLNISEIAYEVGFNDPKYFTRCFTKHFGIQPSAFMDEEKESGNTKPSVGALEL